MKYVSRRYLKEKWQSLKWDMEIVLGVLADSQDDDLSEAAKGVSWEVCDLMKSIAKEIGGSYD